FPLSEVEITANAATATGAALSYSASAGPNFEYQWSFGDGTPPTAFSPDPAASHTFATAGRYNVVVTVHDLLTSEEQSFNVTQIVHDAAIDPNDDGLRRLSSTPVAFHPTRDEIWNVNPDNDTATVIAASTLTKLAEIPVGPNPRSLAVATDGRIWVVSKGRSEIHVIDPASLTVADVFPLSEGVEGRAAHGIVFAPSGTVAYVALEYSGEVVEIDATTGEILRIADVGERVRHLGVSRDGALLYISRFITPPVPGEDSALPDVAAGGGELVVLETGDFASQSTILLHHSDDAETENTGPGLPNYLGPPALSPDASVAYVPSKQDNVLGGAQRPGQDLDFDHTVRAISSRIDLVTETERTPDRIDHDNASFASHAVFGPYGIHLFSALEGNRQVAISDTLTDSEIVRFDVGRAPQGLALSTDGQRLAVHNFMSRSVEVIDVSDVVEFGGVSVASLGTVQTVANETLTPEVLLGKQHFYDAKDDRLAGLDYMSCASCHNAAGSDGRTWDFSQFGEGLRSTIGLEGRGQGHGPLHWTANFDEVQDFEGQIRSFALGLGLMSDEDFETLDRSDPLGAPKAGLSPDLDALAAYVESLDSVGVSPFRQGDGSLSTEGAAGQVLFGDYGCDSCHSGAVFTDSEDEVLHDVGTLVAESGPQTALDTPSLLGAWTTPPYLHDGSAETLEDAIEAHSLLDLSMSEEDLGLIAAYVSEIDDLEATANLPDADGDGFHDGIDAFPNDASEWADSDNDGVGDNSDAFPNDPSESADSDNDGVGDNADAFPNDSSETVDSDGDGVGDNSDVFPNDPNEWADLDGDGVGDNADAFDDDPTEWSDRDGDGIGDNSDPYPDDPTNTPPALEANAFGVTDASTGIDPSTITYTHAVDFNAAGHPANINGLAFYNATTRSGPGWSLSNPPNSFTGHDSAADNSSQLDGLLANFWYGDANGVTLTLT
ncbi:MAG: PKD domain-containing protein, partial [Ilumatobacteraceae bacterium]